MNTVPIKSFADVIAFELQSRLLKQLTFSQIWRICENAAPSLEAHKERSQFQNMLVRDIYNAVEDLEQKKLITVIRRRVGRYNRILQIDVTPEGKLHLEKTMFTHQPHSCPADCQSVPKTDSHK